jgi:Transcription factor WhiB
MQKWKDQAKCLNLDTEYFFSKYEEDFNLASSIDSMCRKCPVNRRCFAVGVSNKEWGVWGGIYLKDGTIDKEFNAHKDKSAWFETWKSLTMEEQ